MRKPTVPKLSRWPFYAGDALLLVIAIFLCVQHGLPLGLWPMILVAFCGALAAMLGVLPFLLEYRAAVKLAETEGLTSVVTQIKNLEHLAAQIGYATSQWQIVRESADKTAGTAKEIAQGMASEIRGFNEFLQRANADERATLRLEAEKLRRAEGDWVQVIVRLLDHVFALHQAAQRSRQPGIAEQLAKFQAACHDVARRVGLTPFIAAPAELFDAQRHQLIDDKTPAPANAAIDETVASGYTFQGKLLRPALVRLRNGHGTETAPPAATRSDAATAAV